MNKLISKLKRWKYRTNKERIFKHCLKENKPLSYFEYGVVASVLAGMKPQGW